MASTQPESDPGLILSINAGSSSVKITVYTSPQPGDSNKHPEALATAEVSSITSPPCTLTSQIGTNGPKEKGTALPDSVHDQASAFEHILGHFTSSKDLPQLRDKADVRRAVHRIVHGGTYTHARALDAPTLDTLAALSDLAPLHNAVGLDLVRSAQQLLPSARQYAYFDTAFHASIPPAVHTYAIDQAVAKRNGLRKYGFHGISYAFITRAVAAHLGKEEADVNIIALHLGSGASACAIRAGKSVDTSMGLTPLAGLPGGSRSGDVDPR